MCYGFEYKKRPDRIKPYPDTALCMLHILFMSVCRMSAERTAGSDIIILQSDYFKIIVVSLMICFEFFHYSRN